MATIQHFSDEHNMWLDGDGDHDGRVEDHEVDGCLAHLREGYPDVEWRAVFDGVIDARTRQIVAQVNAAWKKDTDGFYALPADDGIEVRRNADDEVIGYLPSRATDGVDADDPAAVMASRHFRVVDEDGDVI